MTKHFSQVPVVDRINDFLRPTPEASGPYGGLHGGVVSGILVGDLERQARENGWGQSLSATAWLLRPCAMADLSPRPKIVKSGGRLTMAENELYAGDKIQARAAVTFMNAVPNTVLPTPPADVNEAEADRIEALPQFEFMNHVFKDKPKPPIFSDAQDIRRDGNEQVWLRERRPLVPDAGPLARAISQADFATVFGVVLKQDWMPMAWPNANITVHLFRDPIGEWIGVKPTYQWYSNGNGMTEAVLSDTNGAFGRSCQNVALTQMDQ